MGPLGEGKSVACSREQASSWQQQNPGEGELSCALTETVCSLRLCFACRLNKDLELSKLTNPNSQTRSERSSMGTY